jgi:hypothetical protein
MKPTSPAARHLAELTREAGHEQTSGRRFPSRGIRPVNTFRTPPSHIHVHRVILRVAPKNAPVR